jgi:hypothetical protein
MLGFFASSSRCYLPFRCSLLLFDEPKGVFAFRTEGRLSAAGTKRTCGHVHVESEMCRIADVRTGRNE